MKTVPEEGEAVNPVILPGEQKKEGILLSPFYNSAVNAVTRPGQMAWCSQYFIDRWSPILGAEGMRIVMTLRRHAFNDRKKGVKREDVVMEQSELAKLVGCSEDTLSRQIGGINKKTGQPFNPWIAYFVRKQTHKKRHASGRISQEVNGYWVAMDDPIHPDDWSLVEQYVHEREGVVEKGDVPEPQNAGPVVQPEPQNAGSVPQSAGLSSQNAGPGPQNAGRINESKTLNTLITLNTPAADGVSLTLFPEKTEATQTWAHLTEAEQQAFRAQAERELIALVGLSGWQGLRASGRDRQVQARAKTLYKASFKRVE